MRLKIRPDASQQDHLDRSFNQFLEIPLIVTLPSKLLDQIFKNANSGPLLTPKVAQNRVINIILSPEKGDRNMLKDSGIEPLKPYRNLYQTDSDRVVPIGALSSESLKKMRQKDTNVAPKGPIPTLASNSNCVCSSGLGG